MGEHANSAEIPGDTISNVDVSLGKNSYLCEDLDPRLSKIPRVQTFRFGVYANADGPQDSTFMDFT